MESEIVNKLQLKTFKPTREGGGGCISSGSVYETDQGKVFIKKNCKNGADIMFHGEYYGLKALAAAGFPVPKVLLAGKNYLVMEYAEMSGLQKYAAQLGHKLAELHQCPRPTDRFGFECPTSCGFIAMDNTWCSDWVQFYMNQRIQPHVDRLADSKLNQLWSQLKPIIPTFFKDIQVKPSLLHGDLWSGNAADGSEGAISFDPAAFYGHAEFDLAIAKMFGGFPKSFFDAYHSRMPKQPGFDRRQDLYILFHNLNHWSHFGSGYRNSSLDIMERLMS